MLRFQRVFFALACLGALAASPGAAAADYPARPVTMVVPFPAGGPTDLVARVLAKEMSARLGQSIVVENKGGANANIGMQHVAGAAADGYTLLYNTSSLAMNPALYRQLPYDPATAFAPVSTTAIVPMALLTHPSVPVDDLAGFIRYARENPGRLSYGSAGPGNITHLSAFLFFANSGIDAVHVPYRGSAPAMADLAGGQVQMMVNTINDSLAFVQSGRVKALAVTTAERSQVLPDVPTIAEAADPDFNLGAWQGLVVPAGTPAEIVATLNRSVRESLASDEVQQQLALQGAIVLGSSPEEYGEFIASERERWQQVVQAAGVQLD